MCCAPHHFPQAVLLRWWGGNSDRHSLYDALTPTELRYGLHWYPAMLDWRLGCRELRLSLGTGCCTLVSQPQYQLLYTGMPSLVPAVVHWYAIPGTSCGTLVCHPWYQLWYTGIQDQVPAVVHWYRVLDPSPGNVNRPYV